MEAGLDMNAELWKLANVITGFAVAQGIAFALALGRDFAHLQYAPMRAKIAITIVSILFASLYSTAVHQCCVLAIAEGSKAVVVWEQVTLGRHFAIWMFTLVGVFGLFAVHLAGISAQHETESGADSPD